MNIGAIVQARISSQRLPGKVLKTVKEKPLLQYLIERLGQCREIDSIIIATSRERSDDPVAAFCANNSVSCFRGSLDNVAGRFNEILQQNQWDGFARVNGDSPLIDQQLIDRGIVLFRRGAFDIVTNVFPRSYPPGQSVEIIRKETFLSTYPKMTKKEDLEHVTSFFYNNPEDFSIYNFTSGNDYGKIHLSVDTPKDFQVFMNIISSMKKPHWEYHLEDIIGLLLKVK